MLWLCRRLVSHNAFRSFPAPVSLPSSFPHFDLHCCGYNEVRGPSHNLVSSIFMATVDRDADFLDRCASFLLSSFSSYHHFSSRDILTCLCRFMCGLGGEAVTSDQHHHVARKIRVFDSQTVSQERPADGLISLVNEKSQV